jgi:hypothetical protein
LEVPTTHTTVKIASQHGVSLGKINAAKLQNAEWYQLNREKISEKWEYFMVFAILLCNNNITILTEKTNVGWLLIL